MSARLVPQYSPKSPIAEAYRTFRTNTVSLPPKISGEGRIYLVTSSGPKEGKSTSSSNLAITLSQMRSKTVIVDCDMRRPMVHNLFFVSRENGLSRFLTTEDVDIHDIIKPSGMENLDIITAGHVPPNPSELLSSKKMDDLFAKLREEYDYIIVDSPPIIAVTDALIIAKKVDHLVLVIRVNSTEREIIEQAKSLLKNIDVKVAGVVVNGIEVKKYYSGYKYYYYYYYYYYTDDEKGAKKKREKVKVTQDSRAKLNLFLDILHKRDDGFHEVETIIVPISLADHLIFRLTYKSEVKIYCTSDTLQESENIIYKIACFLKDTYNVKHGVEIKLKKNIPLSAGLGGGSSNAAITILVLNSLWKLNLSLADLHRTVALFGSDINFFLDNKNCPCRRKG